MAQNAIDDFLEDAEILMDGSREMHSLYTRWHAIARISLALSFISAFSSFKISWIFSLSLTASFYLFTYWAMNRAEDYLDFSESLQHQAGEKMLGAENMQIWLDAVIASN